MDQHTPVLWTKAKAEEIGGFNLARPLQGLKKSGWLLASISQGPVPEINDPTRI